MPFGETLMLPSSPAGRRADEEDVLPGDPIGQLVVDLLEDLAHRLDGATPACHDRTAGLTRSTRPGATGAPGALPGGTSDVHTATRWSP